MSWISKRKMKKKTGRSTIWHLTEMRILAACLCIWTSRTAEGQLLRQGRRGARGLVVPWWHLQACGLQGGCDYFWMILCPLEMLTKDHAKKKRVNATGHVCPFNCDPNGNPPGTSISADLVPSLLWNAPGAVQALALPWAACCLIWQQLLGTQNSL